MTNDPTWQAMLYEAESSRLLLYGRALGLGHCETEDVLHETFLALGRLDTAPVNPAHYLLRSFRNRALNYRRGLWRRLVREFESRQWFERSEGETLEERAAMRCLENLPREQREVIVLKIWHEHTFEGIGGLLGISPHTAAGRYRYGLKKLKACLNGQSYEQLERESSGDQTAFLETSSSVGAA